MELSLIIGGLVSATPGLVVWIVALVLSSVLMKRGGGRTERFLIIGSCLMLVSIVLRIPQAAIVPYLIQNGLSNVSAVGVLSGVNLFLGLISLAGVVCLFYAIWKEFNDRTNIIAND